MPSPPDNTEFANFLILAGSVIPDCDSAVRLWAAGVPYGWGGTCTGDPKVSTYERSCGCGLIHGAAPSEGITRLSLCISDIWLRDALSRFGLLGRAPC